MIFLLQVTIRVDTVLLLCPKVTVVMATVFAQLKLLFSHLISFEGVYGLSEKGREGSNNGIYGHSFREEVCCL